MRGSSSRRTRRRLAGANVAGMRRPTLSDLATGRLRPRAATVLARARPRQGWVEWFFFTIVISRPSRWWGGCRGGCTARPYGNEDTAARLQALPADGGRAAGGRPPSGSGWPAISRGASGSRWSAVVRPRRGGLAAAADPTTALRRVQAEAQQANTELRRQLGLLRPRPTRRPSPASGEPEPSRRFGSVRGLPGRRRGDRRGGGRPGGRVTVRGLGPGRGRLLVLTLGSAATVVFRRVAPRSPGRWLCAALIALGAIIDAPVADGFSFPLAVGILAWSAGQPVQPARPGRRSPCWSASPWSAGCSTSRPTRRSTPCCWPWPSSAGPRSAAAGRSRTAAQDAASARGRVLQAAADEAVRAERQQIARELHDLVSHAVSVIAVQAGAAELSWPKDPATVRRAIDVVAVHGRADARRARSALAGGRAVPHDLAELEALCGRIRSAGLSVTLDRDGVLPDAAASTVYRVVQESLTNALRHAPGSRVAVRVTSRRRPDRGVGGRRRARPARRLSSRVRPGRAGRAAAAGRGDVGDPQRSARVHGDRRAAAPYPSPVRP